MSNVQCSVLDDTPVLRALSLVAGRLRADVERSRRLDRRIADNNRIKNML
jgi:hypothetical protein